MRLLHATELRMQDFFGSAIPDYAILSHRWESEEVSYQDFQRGVGPQRRGWAKIEGCRKQALSDGYEWCWVDTCCIDKTSSAELSEAINSMFDWYSNSQACYVYLCDVDTISGAPAGYHTPIDESAWFERGWTLQELLAPQYVDFFSASWTWLGSKRSLEETIRTRTGIQDLWQWKRASVAQKLCWASQRRTTRIEDMAYALLGIFGIHMPPLYGEGRNAFIRLQLEIMNKLDDDSLFAWEGPFARGLLAPTPMNFSRATNVVRVVVDPNRPHHTSSGRGVGVHFIHKKMAPLPSAEKFEWPGGKEGANDKYIALLNCARAGPAGYTQLGVPLQRTAVGGADHSFVWERAYGELLTYEMDATTEYKLASLDQYKRSILYVPQPETRIAYPVDLLSIDMDSVLAAGANVRSIYGTPEVFHKLKAGDLAKSDIPTTWFEGKTIRDFAAAIYFDYTGSDGFALILGVRDGEPWINVLSCDDCTFETAQPPACFPINARCERVSRYFQHGTLNARVHGMRFPGSRPDVGSRSWEDLGLGRRTKRHVVLTFDAHETTLRWPSTVTPRYRTLAEVDPQERAPIMCSPSVERLESEHA